MLQLYKNQPSLVFFIIAANIALSTWCLWQDPVINLDGIIYVTLAELITQGKFEQAFEYYSWPFYSIFIAIISKLLLLEAEMAAFVFNGLMAISLSLAFVCIVADLSNNNRRVVFIAVVLILLLPSISKYRAFVIRDFGYLSCYLWSLFFLFRFCRNQQKSYLLAWLAFAALSSLFRFEGLIFVFIAPYFLFLFGTKSMPHRKKLLILLSGLITVITLALIAWYVNDKYADAVKAARLAGDSLSGLSDFFIANIPGESNRQKLSFSMLVGFVLTNVTEVLVELIRRMAVFYFVLSLCAYYFNWGLNRPLIRKMWLVYIMVNLFLLVGFSLYNSFFVSRYTMATVLTLLLLAPFSIDRLIAALSQSNVTRKIAIYSLLFSLLLASIEGLDVHTNKHYIKQAGLWVRDNVDPNATIDSNNRLAIYYARDDAEINLHQLYSTEKLVSHVKNRQLNKIGYVMLIGENGNFHEDWLRKTLTVQYGHPLKTFTGTDGRWSSIYRIQ